MCLNQDNLSISPDIAKKLLRQTGVIDIAISQWPIWADTHEENRYDNRTRQFIGNILDILVYEGAKSLGRMKAIHVITSGETEINFNVDLSNFRIVSRDKKFDPKLLNETLMLWNKMHRNNPERNNFEAQTGTLKATLPLESILTLLESDENCEGVLFASEIETEPVKEPESMIAKIWNECLGPKPIPFDPAAREALISKGCKHPELERHIKAWKEMKRTGSKWGTGGR